MSSKDSKKLICLVGPAVKKKNTTCRNAIIVLDCLVITMRLFATGVSYHSMMYLFKGSMHSVSLIPEVSEMLINADTSSPVHGT
jgi:hypothetical protein